MKTTDFQPGDHVRYVPPWAKGNANHESCENGVVSSVNDTFVFVKYIRGGALNTTATATRPDCLIKDYMI